MQGRNATDGRLVGRYDEGRSGPLVIALCAVHGNEPAGLAAAERMLAALRREAEAVADFAFRGRLVGLVGNVGARRVGRRFLRHDLNRNLAPDHVERLGELDDCVAEDAEAVALTAAVRAEVAAYRPERIVVVDLHTTTAAGGAFSIVGDGAEARRLALACHAPVVLGLLAGDGLTGTTMHAFTTESLGVPTAGVVFEAGQHTEPAAIERSLSALTLLLEAAGCVAPRHVDPRHAQRLRDEFAHLPAAVRLRYVHRIAPRDRFVMRPGYVNFDRVGVGEVLADDRHGEVRCPADGRILMPLYQPQGGEGYFLVRDLVI